MKKLAKQIIFSTILVMTMTVAMMAQTPVAPSNAGDMDAGTSANPYIIATLENLYWIAAGDAEVPSPGQSVRWSAHYIQTADIDAAVTSGWFAGEGWSPIGINFLSSFTGSYNGNGNTISNLLINRPSGQNIGLFGYISGLASISNLGVVGDVTANSNAGLLVGFMDGGSISQCFTDGTITSGNGRVGGLLGVAFGGSVSNSYAQVTVIGDMDGSSFGERAGGLFAQLNTGVTVTNCYAVGQVSAFDGFMKAGLGTANGGTVTNSFYDSDISTTTSGAGTPRTTAQMQQQATFTNWDFQCESDNGMDNIWGIDEGNDYPVLSVFGYMQDCCASFSVAGEAPTIDNGVYQVATFENLLWISENVSSWGADFVQTVDIDAALTGDECFNVGGGWSPIGNTTTRFTGTYNGGGFTISNLFINRPNTDAIGLFGSTENATIQNLGLVNVNITGQNQVGGLVGLIDNTTISQVFVIGGTVTGDNETGFLGGLIGRSFTGSSISDVYTIVQVNNIDPNGAAAGLVGQYDSQTISNAYVAGQVNVSAGFSFLRRAIGQQSGSTCNNCYFDNTINNDVSAGQGQGRSTAQMLLRSTFLGFDFDAVWTSASLGLNNLASYPYLQNQQNITPAQAPNVGPATVANRTREHNYVTIQSAIDDADAGDLITLGNGTNYMESPDFGDGPMGGVGVSAGSSPGCSTIDGALNLTSSDDFVVDIEGAVACTGYDQITVTGSVNLNDANLVINLDYVPQDNDVFTILSYGGALAGTFAQGTSMTVNFNGVAYNFIINYGSGTADAITLSYDCDLNPPVAQTAGSGSICAPDMSYTLLPSNANASNGSIQWTIIDGQGTLTDEETLEPTYTIGGADAPGDDIVIRLTVTCDMTTATADFVINYRNIPVPDPLMGDTEVCSGKSIVLTSATPGGTFSSDMPGIATVDELTGEVTGVAVGTATITYTVDDGGCLGSVDEDVEVIEGAVAGTASANQTICVGSTPALLNLTGSVGNIQWQISSNNINFVNLSGATNSTYQPGPLSATRFYRAVVTNGTTLCTDTSNVVTITTVPAPVESTISGNQTICEGGMPAVLMVTGATTGIQWQSSTDNMTFANVMGANAVSFSPGILTQTTFYRVVVSSSPCSDFITNVVTITVDDAVSPGTLSEADQTVCPNGAPDPVTLSGFTGTIKWQISFNNINFTDISGATAATLTTAQMGGTITQTTYFRAVVTSGTCGDVFSAVHTVEVSTANAGTISMDQAICDGEVPDDVVLSGFTGTIQWQISTDGINFTDIVGQTMATLPGSAIGALSADRAIRALVTDGPNCVDVPSPIHDIVVNPIPPAPMAAAMQSICSDGTPTLADVEIMGSNIQWYADAGATMPIPVSTPLVDGETYYASQTIDGCESTALTSITITLIGDVAAAPSAPSRQYFCGSPRVSDLFALGSNLRWYANQMGGSPLSSTTLLSNNATYWVAQVTVGCESPRVPVTVVINTLNTSTCDIRACSSSSRYCENDVVILTASLNGSHTTGERLWRQIAGPWVIINNPTSLSTSIEGFAQNQFYVFTFQSRCTSGILLSDTISFSVGATPIANAGEDVSGCPDTPLVLNANMPASGETGIWTIIFDPEDETMNANGVSVPFPNSPTGPVSLAQGNGGVTTLRWRVQNNTTGCFRDDFLEVINCGGENPINAEVFFAENVTLSSCYTISTSTIIDPTRDGSTPDFDGCGVESSLVQVSGPSQINIGTRFWSDADQRWRYSISNLIEGTYVIRYEVTNGCFNGFDEFTFNVPAPEGVATQAVIDKQGTPVVNGFHTFYICEGTENYIFTGSQPQNVGETILWDLRNASFNQDGLLSTTSYSGPMTVSPDTSSTSTQVSNLQPGTYSLAYIIRDTVTNCASFDRIIFVVEGENVNIEVEDEIVYLPCGSSMGSIPFAFVGGDTTEVRFLSGPGISGPTDWQVVSSSPFVSSSFTSNGVYELEFRRRGQNLNASCGVAYDRVTVVRSSPASIATVGPTQFRCAVTTTTLTGNIPISGTGLWTQVEGPNMANIVNPSLRNTQVTSLIAGNYVFRWTISNGPACPSNSADLRVIVSNTLPAPGMTYTENVCFNTPVQLQSRALLSSETINWIVFSTDPSPVPAVTFSSATDPFPVVTGLQANTTYVFRYLVSNGCGSTDQDITIITSGVEGPFAANAGADICQSFVGNPTTIMLNGNLPAGHTGQWTYLPVNMSLAAPVIDDDEAADTDVTFSEPGIYKFIWTLNRGTGCEETTDTVTVNVQEMLAPVANAGPNQNVCGSSTTMAANDPAPGIGTWTQVTGPAGVVIANVNDPETSISGLIDGQNYTFEWTIEQEGCGSSMDIVALSVSAAGDDAVIPMDVVSACGTTTAMVTADPATGGFWRFVSGPIEPTLSNTTTNVLTVSDMLPGSYVVSWNVPSGGPNCPPSVALATIHVVPDANAGDDITICDVTELVGLSGNFIGTWTQISGPSMPPATITMVSNNQVAITDLETGTYVFQYEINTLGCMSTDDMTLQVNATPTTVADAGGNQTLCDITEITLAGNAPGVGEVGQWVVEFGSGTFDPDANTHNATFTPTAPATGTYRLSWTISSTDGCSYTNTDEMWIFNYPTVSPGDAMAGAMQNICPSTTNLEATLPQNYGNNQVGIIGTQCR